MFQRFLAANRQTIIADGYDIACPPWDDLTEAAEAKAAASGIGLALAERGTGAYTVAITAGPHHWLADEPANGATAEMTSVVLARERLGLGEGLFAGALFAGLLWWSLA